MTQGTNVRSISYTADGNTLTDNFGTGAVFTYSYNNDNRMVQASLGGATQASDTLNYLGQRVIKSAVGSGTTHFHYDRFGHLIAESDGAGHVLREYVFLGDTPVAFITPTGGIDIIHTDHLGTPQKMTDASQTVVWDGGASDPFMMSHLPLTPAMNQRLPGQYFDGETGLHYNYFRDYDPSLGRYIESDPIGLRGGINTYGYVSENPMSNADPFGLWQFTVSGGSGLGGQLTFGYNSGQWNIGLWGGVGEGFSWNFNPFDSGCNKPGLQLSAKVQVNWRLGKFAGGGASFTRGPGLQALNVSVGTGRGTNVNVNSGNVPPGSPNFSGSWGSGTAAMGGVGGQVYW